MFIDFFKESLQIQNKKLKEKSSKVNKFRLNMFVKIKLYLYIY